MAATAALLWACRPSLTAPQVDAQILASADPSPDGPGSPAYGAGILNPYRAVTEEWPATVAAAAAAPVRVAVRPAASLDGTGGRALRLAGAGAGLVALVLLGGLVLPRGARRAW